MCLEKVPVPGFLLLVGTISKARKVKTLHELQMLSLCHSLFKGHYVIMNVEVVVLNCQ